MARIPEAKARMLFKRKRVRGGAAAAEFALISPIIAILIVGMIEMSRATMIRVVLSDAVRKGCQTGMLASKSNADISTDVTDVLRDNGFDSTKFNPPSTGSLTITIADPNGVTLSDAQSAPSGSSVSVQVSIPIRSTMWMYSWFVDPSASQTAQVTMMKE
jgi:Flp pilus assembly protein TadG